MISITDNKIEIHAHFFTGQETGFTEYHKELISDILENHYNNQIICIKATDGENLERCGFINYITWACKTFDILSQKVYIQTTNTDLFGNFVVQYSGLTIFDSARHFLTIPFQRQTTTKFVGLSIGRFTPSRFRLVYELDNAFTNNTFLIFHPSLTSVKTFYKKISGAYEKEIAWLESKKFDTDLIYVNDPGQVGWKDSYSNYHNIWDKFDIEVIAETDTHSNHWFTEKTARCLITGKPFVILSGINSLANLQNAGYKTFSEIIDESYDTEPVTTRRINKIIASLNNLYQSPDRNSKITRMYEIAQHNITNFKKNAYSKI
jgi:hypothetical protein